MQVSDGALRCFASLADRFTRRGVDPAPLAEHGLSSELLERLASAAASAGEKTGSSVATPDSKSNSTSVSTIVSLLSTLCRGSPSVTHVCKQPADFMYMYMYIRADLDGNKVILAYGCAYIVHAFII